MRGKVLIFDEDTNEGKILGEDEQVVEFHIGEWLSRCKVLAGQEVCYEVVEDEAREILVSDESVFRVRIDVCLVR